MPLDPCAPFPTDLHAIAADKHADHERRVAALERRQVAVAPTPWTDATLVNGFTNVGGDYAPASYYRDPQGRVFTRGRANVPVDAEGDETIFVYDEGFRPLYVHEFMLIAGTFEDFPVRASAEVHPDGRLVFQGALVEQIPLDVIQFRTL